MSILSKYIFQWIKFVSNKLHLFNDEKSEVQYRTIYLQIERRNKLSFFYIKRFIF
jgi:hypothetical protein